MIMFICEFLFFLVTVIFVPWQLGKFFNWRLILRISLGLILVLILAETIPAMIRANHSTEFLPWGPIYNFVGLFTIYMLYLDGILLVGWFIKLFFKKLQMGKKFAVFSIVLPLLLVGYGWINVQSFKVIPYEVKMPKLKNEITFMHISDLHLGMQRGNDYLQKVVDAINHNKPDFVIYNGDLADSNFALNQDLFKLFKNVRTKQFFVLGNHEYYIDTMKVLRLLMENNVEILRNRMVNFKDLQIIGLDYMNADSVTYDTHPVNSLTVQEELPKIPRDPAIATLLAHHTPKGFKYVAEAGIELMISGHTHNGQLWPGNILIAMIFPHSIGKYVQDNTTLLISQGAGTFFSWMRLGTFSEIQLIKLKP